MCEVWPVAADGNGLWLLSGKDAWRTKPSTPIGQDSDPHFEVESLLAAGGVLAPTLVHSTSWRVDGSHIMLTYVAVVGVPEGGVIETWPQAQPFTADVLHVVGPTITHGAAEAPTPRYIDVLAHGVRHLVFLKLYDATAAEALPAEWTPHLARLTPALAGMYSQVHDTA